MLLADRLPSPRGLPAFEARMRIARQRSAVPLRIRTATRLVRMASARSFAAVLHTRITVPEAYATVRTVAVPETYGHGHALTVMENHGRALSAHAAIARLRIMRALGRLPS